MDVRKKNIKEARKESKYTIELIKDEETGDLLYLDEKGVPVKISGGEGIEALEVEVSANTAAIGALPATTTVTVTITDTEVSYDDGRATVVSGIVNMGDIPVDLLPSPGAGNYYEGDITVKFTPGATAYSIGALDKLIAIYQGTYGMTFNYVCEILGATFITDTVPAYFRCPMTGTLDSSLLPPQKRPQYPLDEPVRMQSWDSGGAPYNFQLGDGVLEVVISYTVKAS